MFRSCNRWFRRTMHRDSEGGGGGGTSSDDGVSQEELEQQAQQAVEDGRALQKITQLLQDNYEQREQLRQLRDRLPDDNQLVLEEDQVEQLREVGAIGEDGEVKADDLQERLEKAEEAQDELEALRKREQRREVCEVTGLNGEAAEDILPDDLEFEVEEGDEDEGATAYVQTEDGRQPVEKYVEESFSSPIQNALFAKGEEGEDEDSSPSVPEQTPAGEDNPSDEPDEDEIRQQKRSQIKYGV